MPGWLGPWEILIVVVIILLVFGGKLLPRLGRSLGSSFTGLKKGVKEGGEEFKTAIKEDEQAAAMDVKVDATAAQAPPVAPTQTSDGAGQPPADKTQQN
jgi:sec-independent protein translocase protein TatA